MSPEPRSPRVRSANPAVLTDAGYTADDPTSPDQRVLPRQPRLSSSNTAVPVGDALRGVSGRGSGPAGPPFRACADPSCEQHPPGGLALGSPGAQLSMRTRVRASRGQLTRGPAGELDQAGRDLAAVDDRESPTDRVRSARAAAPRTRRPRRRRWGRRPAGSGAASSGRTDRGGRHRQERRGSVWHGPRLRWRSAWSAKTSTAVRTKRATPSGCRHAPRPSTSPHSVGRAATPPRSDRGR